MTETTVTAAGILTKARDILIERGVERGGWFINEDTECQVCSMGAIYLAAGGEVVVSTYMDSEWDEETSEYIGEVERKSVSIGGYTSDAAMSQATDILTQTTRADHPEVEYFTVPLWNDRTTTDAEVIEAFNKAIAAATN
jgi:hypothetical protein